MINRKTGSFAAGKEGAPRKGRNLSKPRSGVREKIPRTVAGKAESYRKGHFALPSGSTRRFFY